MSLFIVRSLRLSWLRYSTFRNVLFVSFYCMSFCNFRSFWWKCAKNSIELFVCAVVLFFPFLDAFDLNTLSQLEHGSGSVVTWILFLWYATNDPEENRPWQSLQPIHVYEALPNRKWIMWVFKCTWSHPMMRRSEKWELWKIYKVEEKNLTFSNLLIISNVNSHHIFAEIISTGLLLKIKEGAIQEGDSVDRQLNWFL